MERMGKMDMLLEMEVRTCEVAKTTAAILLLLLRCCYCCCCCCCCCCWIAVAAFVSPVPPGSVAVSASESAPTRHGLWQLGITGGEEDGVDNENANPEDLYTKPEEVWMVQKALQEVPNAKFTIAAAFGNVHGVYAPGNVKLDPKILRNSQVTASSRPWPCLMTAPLCRPLSILPSLCNLQSYIAQQLGMPAGSKPCSFVFHGGSGSDINDIKVPSSPFCSSPCVGFLALPHLFSHPSVPEPLPHPGGDLLRRHQDEH